MESFMSWVLKELHYLAVCLGDSHTSTHGAWCHCFWIGTSEVEMVLCIMAKPRNLFTSLVIFN
jgi:homoaconitase/3-isopropylmalate dehydratase large subunit